MAEDHKKTEQPQKKKTVAVDRVSPVKQPEGEIGGTAEEPTRFGDWAHKGRVSDF